jgi:hypothetical protein
MSLADFSSDVDHFLKKHFALFIEKISREDRAWVIRRIKSEHERPYSPETESYVTAARIYAELVYRRSQRVGLRPAGVRKPKRNLVKRRRT